MSNVEPGSPADAGGHSFLNSGLVKTGLLYVVLLAGGLWHILSWFQSAMTWLAAPLIMAIAGWVIFEASRGEMSANRRWWLWLAFVFVASIALEWVGVKTGKVFGDYHYGSVLKPFIGPVPLAIGFAWILMTLSGLALAQRALRDRAGEQIFAAAGLTAFFMLIFDLFMESAAMRLDYWQWANGVVDLANYRVWFVGGFIFTWLGLKFKALPKRIPSLAIHAYFAQLLYFILVNLSH